MYFAFIFLIVLFVPVPIMARMAARGATPYRAVVEGIIAVVIGTVLIFILASATGQPVGAELRLTLGAAAEILADNSGLTAMLGIGDLSHVKRVAVLNQVYDYAIYSFPATVLMWAAIVSYFEYMLFAKFASRRNAGIQQMPPFKYFCLPRNALIGFVLIFVLSWLVTVIGLLPRETLFVNVNLLFEFAFCIQGAAVLFFFCDSKRIPKFVALILTVLFLSMSFGKMLLFLLGITDLAFGLRARMSQKLRR